MKKRMIPGTPISKEHQKNIIGGLLDPGGGGADSCSVTCGSGYYACCNGPSAPSCNCVVNGTTATCNAGGAGNSTCNSPTK